LGVKFLSQTKPGAGVVGVGVVVAWCGVGVKGYLSCGDMVTPKVTIYRARERIKEKDGIPE